MPSVTRNPYSIRKAPSRSSSSTASTSRASQRPLSGAVATSTGSRSSSARTVSRNSRTRRSSRRPGGSLALPASSRPKRRTYRDAWVPRTPRPTVPLSPRSPRPATGTRAYSARPISHTYRASLYVSSPASRPRLATTSLPAQPTSRHTPSRSSSGPGLRSGSRGLKRARAGVARHKAGLTRTTWPLMASLSSYGTCVLSSYRTSLSYSRATRRYRSLPTPLSTGQSRTTSLALSRPTQQAQVSRRASCYSARCQS